MSKSFAFLDVLYTRTAAFFVLAEQNMKRYIVKRLKINRQVSLDSILSDPGNFAVITLNQYLGWPHISQNTFNNTQNFYRHFDLMSDELSHIPHPFNPC